MPWCSVMILKRLKIDLLPCVVVLVTTKRLNEGLPVRQSNGPWSDGPSVGWSVCLSVTSYFSAY